MTRLITKYGILLLTTVLHASQHVCAQYTDSTTHMLAYNLNGSFNKANDGRAYLLNNNFHFGIQKKRISLNTNHSWLYGKQNADLTNNDYTATFDFNVYASNRKFFWWGLANYNTSYSLKINNQLLAGAGIAYSIFDNGKAYLNLSDGILYDQADLQMDAVREQYHTFRNSFRLQFRFAFLNRAVFEGNGFFQPSLNYRDDYMVRSSVSLSVQLRKWLAVTSAFNYNRYNRTKSENMLLTYGLKAEGYF